MACERSVSRLTRRFVNLAQSICVSNVRFFASPSARRRTVFDMHYPHKHINLPTMGGCCALRRV